jgi:hypothetical protein
MSAHQSVTQTKESDTAAKQQSSPNRSRSGSQTPHPAVVIQRAMADPNSLTASDILTLQRTVGNQVVLRMFSQFNGIKDQSRPVAEMAAQAGAEVQRQTPGEEELKKKPAAQEAGLQSMCSAMYQGEREDGTEQPKPETEIFRPGAVSPVTGTAVGGMVSQAPKHVLRRKVGFEFQTVGQGPNVYVWSKKDNDYVVNHEHNRDKDQIAHGEGFKVTADGSELEFVTDAFEEKTTERDNLSKTMDRMQVYTEAVIVLSNRVGITDTEKRPRKPSDMENYRTLSHRETHEKELVKEQSELKVLEKQPGENEKQIEMVRKRINEKQTLLKLPGLLGEAGKIEQIKKTRNQTIEMDKYKIYLPPGVTAHPQSTVGVKLEKIFDLLENLSDKQRENKDDKIGWGSYNKTDQRPAVEAGVKEVKQLQLPNTTDSLKGFLALIASYARGAEATNLKIPNAKDATPVMSRTSLAEIFNKLSDNDKEAFRNLLKDENNLKNILGRQDLNLPLFLNKTQKGTNFSIKNWLGKIADQTKSTDLLTSSPEDSISEIDQNYTKYGDLKKKFKIKRPTDIGLGNVEGAIMELRAIKRGVPYTEWKDTALAVFNLVRKLNGTENEP